jgi:hypothetical protein
MITLKESLLSKTKNKINDVKKLSSTINKELKNIPSVYDFTVRKYLSSNIYVVYWVCPELLKYMRNLCNIDGHSVRMDGFIGIAFTIDDHQYGWIDAYFYDTSKRLYPMHGLRCSGMGAGKTLESVKDHIIKIIKYMTDTEKLAEIMMHYYMFYTNQTKEKMDLSEFIYDWD